MKTLKQILTEMRSKAVESAELGYNNVWIRRSKQDPENSKSYINENASITQASEDKTTEWIYNLWVKTTEEGLEEMELHNINKKDTGRNPCVFFYKELRTLFYYL